jgi:hypothetical protein
MLGSRSWGLVFVAALGLLAAGCAAAPDKLPTATSTAKVKSVKLATGKETFLVATSKVANGIFFTRPPYDMNGAWRTEVKCGIYQTQFLVPSTGAVFGLEADLRGATPTPTEFYGLYARYFQTPTAGLQVFASTHTGNKGQTFFTGATAVDLAIETNGTTVTFFARDAAVGGAFSTVGTTPLSTPLGAHQPGFGFFQAPQGTTIGFTNFRVPVNGAPAAAVSPEQDAMNAVYQAAFNALDAAYAVDGPAVVAPADVTTAQGFLATAKTSLATARTKIEGLAKAPPTPKQKALTAVIQAQKALESADTAFTKKGTKEAKAYVVAVTHKLYVAAWKVTDALIPTDLRAALPTGGLHH